jgi:hypothetical protein
MLPEGDDGLMKDLEVRLAALDPDAGAAIRVIGYFDRLTEAGAGLEAIVRGAAVLAGCPARLPDEPGGPGRGDGARAPPRPRCWCIIRPCKNGSPTPNACSAGRYGSRTGATGSTWPSCCAVSAATSRALEIRPRPARPGGVPASLRGSWSPDRGSRSMTPVLR